MMVKVLVADDEFLIRWSICELLRKEGFATRMVDNGARALEVIEKEEFDYIITDLFMPGADGWDVLERVKRISPRTKVVIITARGSPDTEKMAMTEGAFGYVEKPEIIEKIKGLLKKAQ